MIKFFSHNFYTTLVSAMEKVGRFKIAQNVSSVDHRLRGDDIRMHLELSLIKLIRTKI